MLNFFENFLLTPYKPFEQQYRCYSAAFKQRDDINKGGKIILPASALEQLASLKIQYPMMFEIFNDNKKTHCGVLEFTAEEGKCILPYWIMKNINVDEGDLVKIKNVALPTGTYVKLKPIGQNNFLNISNPKAVLETRLRNFACLTKGDKIIIEYNDHDYELEVIEVKPNDKGAISIVEADVILDFDTSEENFNKDMDKNLTKTLPKNIEPIKEKEEKFSPKNNSFKGPGYTLKEGISPKSGISYENKKNNSEDESEEESEDESYNKNGKFKAFSGRGYSLKDK